MPTDEITQNLKIALKELGVEDFEPVLERPKDTKNGDFSTNVAMQAFKLQKGNIPGSYLHTRGVLAGNPLEMAQKIAEILNSSSSTSQNFAKVEAVSPGFINFYLSNKYLQSQIQNIIKQGDNYGSLTIGKGKKASVEFVSANPTGPLHIGNAVGGPLGDTIANVLIKSGYQVVREYLHNDVGGQVERLGEAIYFELHPDQRSDTYVVQYQGDYIKELSQDVKEALEEDKDFSQEEFIEKAGAVAVEIILEEILKDCTGMGIKFDIVRKESDLRKEVPDVLGKLEKVIKKKDGARWFAPNDEFLKDRETVLVKSDGDYTYFASDIVYHNEKMSKNNLVIDILGSNHSGHVPRLQAAVRALGFDVKNFKVILYQYVRLKRGSEVVKMSKRAGNFVTAREVLDEVGRDAFRFFLLRSAPETHMDFDLELAKKQASDNPVFYVQYAYTRICSIFTKVKSNNFGSTDISLLEEVEEVALIRHLLRLPELIEEISCTFGVHAFTTYAMELATLFHKFYEAHRVISEDNKQTKARLALLEATRITLKNTLDLLGVSAPEKM
jgi:arginyl-tRNA synthetase